MYFAMQGLKNRIAERRRKKAAARKIREFKKRHHFDERRQRWVRNIDGVILPDPDELSGDLPHGFALFGCLILVLRESLLDLANCGQLFTGH